MPGEAALRVSHRGGGIAVDVAEVALSIDQRIAHGERLSHTDEGGVDHRFAVGMEVAARLSADLGTLLVTVLGPQVEFAHRVEDAPLDRLEAIAHVREGAGDDDRHRIVDIAPAELVFDVDDLDRVVLGHGVLPDEQTAAKAARSGSRMPPIVPGTRPQPPEHMRDLCHKSADPVGESGSPSPCWMGRARRENG